MHRTADLDTVNGAIQRVAWAVDQAIIDNVNDLRFIRIEPVCKVRHGLYQEVQGRFQFKPLENVPLLKYLSLPVPPLATASSIGNVTPNRVPTSISTSTTARS